MRAADSWRPLRGSCREHDEESHVHVLSVQAEDACRRAGRRIASRHHAIASASGSMLPEVGEPRVYSDGIVLDTGEVNV